MPILYQRVGHGVGFDKRRFAQRDERTVFFAVTLLSSRYVDQFANEKMQQWRSSQNIEHESDTIRIVDREHETHFPGKRWYCRPCLTA